MDRTCHPSPTSGLYVAPEQVGLLPCGILRGPLHQCSLHTQPSSLCPSSTTPADTHSPASNHSQSSLPCRCGPQPQPSGRRSTRPERLRPPSSCCTCSASGKPPRLLPLLQCHRPSRVLAADVVALSLCISSAPQVSATYTVDLAGVRSTIIRRETAGVRRRGRARREPLSLSRPPLRQPLLTAFAQLNTRRLLSSSGEVHGAFHGLVRIFTHSSVGVVCVQETCTPQFPCLPDDQPFRYDGPENSHGREAGFLIHQNVPATRVPGLVDSLRIRWRLVSGSVCVCSYYAPHAGSDDSSRIQFWGDRLRLFDLLLVCSQYTPSF